MSKLWGGRFKKNKMDDKVLEFTSSLGVDNILAKHDAFSTRVHVEMLNKCGFIDDKELKSLVSALDSLMDKIDSGKMEFKYDEYEDIHSAVQAYVEHAAPEASKKLHTGRSRNEQVVNSVRLYCKETAGILIEHISKLQSSFLTSAEENIDVIVPGYTHMNHAQPVLYSHLLLAYIEMLERDKERIADAASRCDISVMGSGALAGSALELDRDFIAEKLGFKKVSSNSIDSVSDRDFIVEIVAALSMLMIHLSRLSEDFIMYSTVEFGFIDIGEEYCTGSSLMPQKKNADVFELIRGKSAKVIGALNSLMILMKGLPHSYNRDLQEDKEYLFDSVALSLSVLSISADMVKTITVNREKVSEQLKDQFIFSTDLAEYLVRGGVSFKDAHRIAGNIVCYCIEKNIEFSDLSMDEFKKFSSVFGEDVYGYIAPDMSVKMKKTYGSTNPEFVYAEIEKWKNELY